MIHHGRMCASAKAIGVVTMYSRSTNGSRYAPSFEDWFISRAILPSAQSDAPLNIRIATAQASA